jgi:hypothetical protein
MVLAAFLTETQIFQEQVPKWLSLNERHRRPAGVCAAAMTR